MKINSIEFKSNKGKTLNNYLKHNVSSPETSKIDARNVLEYMSATAPILFGKNDTKKISFEETISSNYFKLPKIKTKKGNTVQALPDKTQLECARSLYEGNNTVCIAPTGTGKTAIANYAITKNMKEGKKTIYTTPLKALSNDKYREFCKLYGTENVGLLTGDIKLNKEAPIVIMTTEIYRNMALDAYAKTNYNKFNNVKTVIFDEAHYISEKERGKIWEESVMLTPPDVQILPLSATIGNGEEFTKWISSVTSLPTKLVEASPKDRHVPLVYYNYTGDRKNGFQELIRGKVNIEDIENNFNQGKMSQRQIRAIDMLIQKMDNKDDDYQATHEEQKTVIDMLGAMTHYQKMPHQQFSEALQKKFQLKELKAQEITQLLLDSDSKSINEFREPTLRKTNKNNYKDLIQALKYDDKLPALVFIFSRKNCNDASAILAESGLNLTSKKEKEEIEKIINEYKEKGIYLGNEFNKNELLQGVASHHAGLLPSYKKLVEDLFSKKLIKVVFATSTLSAGINMPAKTVVITSIDRPQKGESNEIEYVPLTSNEFHQMSGRAGRRGIDSIGNVVLYDIGTKDAQTAKNLILKSPDKAKSKFSPSYSFLPAYYAKCENDELLKYFQANTLKVFQSKNKGREIERLHLEFEKYKNILTEAGFLSRTKKGYKPTTKGQMLTKAHGYNELVLIDSIYNGNLKKLSAPELAAFAASMGAIKSSDDDQNDDNLFAQYLFQNSTNREDSLSLIEVLDAAMEYDDKLDELENENGVENKRNNCTGVFEAAIAHAWASANEDNDSNTVLNFKTIPRRILGKKYDKMPLSSTTRKGLEEGAIYNKIAKSIDVLKQIINICEFMIESGGYEDIDYYKDLIEKSETAIELVEQPPIYDINAIKNDEN